MHLLYIVYMLYCILEYYTACTTIVICYGSLLARTMTVLGSILTRLLLFLVVSHHPFLRNYSPRGIVDYFDRISRLRDTRWDRKVKVPNHGECKVLLSLYIAVPLSMMKDSTGS